MNLMKARIKLIVAGGATAIAVLGGAAAWSGQSTDDGDDETDTEITGSELESASEAALSYLGAGEVTDTEVGDEESYYEVEVALPDGRQVDVQLDEQFQVVGTEDDQ
jgi:uncharacterized membrane protein YkoI